MIGRHGLELIREISRRKNGAPVEILTHCNAGRLPDGTVATVLLCPENTPARNYGFDVTPARLVTKLITERGVCEASEAGILKLFSERKQVQS